MKKILFVVDERKIGGVSILLENILRNLDTSNYKIDVLVLHNIGDRLTFNKENISTYYGPKDFDVIDIDFKSLVKSFHIFKALKKLRLSIILKYGKIEKYIKKVRRKMELDSYDVEIAFKAGFCSLFVAYGNSSKKLNWIHEDYKTYNKTKKYEKTFKKAFRKFEKHILVSQDAQKSFNEIYNLDDKTIVIQNYIDEDYLKIKKDEPSVISPCESSLNFVTLGRFCYEKGFDRLIDIFNSFNGNDYNVKMYIIGDGDYGKVLEDKIKSYNLKDIVVLLDSKSDLNNNPYSFISKCDLFIMPSRTESFGMTRVEALILGVPVLTTNVANSHELINGNIGIITNNTIESLKDAILKVINNKELLASLKKNVLSYTYKNKNIEILESINKLLED